MAITNDGSKYLRTNYRLTGAMLDGDAFDSAFITTLVSFSASEGSYYTAIYNVIGFNASVRCIGCNYALDDAGAGASYGILDFHVSQSYGTAAESTLLLIHARMMYPACTNTISTTANPVLTTSIGGIIGGTSDVCLRVNLLVISADTGMFG